MKREPGYYKVKPIEEAEWQPYYWNGKNWEIPQWVEIGNELFEDAQIGEQIVMPVETLGQETELAD